MALRSRKGTVVGVARRGLKLGKKKAEAKKPYLVFLDENEFIRAKQSGIEFNLGAILDRMSAKIGGTLLRVFVYISEKTELRNFREVRALYASGRAEVRYIKTESLPGEVDRKMRDDIILWSQTKVTDRIVIGTADGGPEFQSAIQSARNNGKEVVLLEMAGSFNRSLSERVHNRVNVTAPNLRKEDFKGLVTEIRLSQKADRRNPNTKFLSAVAIEMRCFFDENAEARFMMIANGVWDRLASVWSPKGYSFDDVRAAISALTHQGYALRWEDHSDMSSGIPTGKLVKVYWLNEDSEVMCILNQE